MKRLTALAGGLTGTAVVAAGLYSWQIEPRRIRVTKVNLPVPDLPEAFEGYRIAHISDLHLNFDLLEEHLPVVVDKVNRLNPDMVAMTGDFTGPGAGLQASTKDLAQFQAPDGAWSVLGNHDYHHGVEEVRLATKRAGMRLLCNQQGRISRGRDSLVIAGVDDMLWGFPDLSAALDGVGPDDRVILLAHEPDYARIAAADPRIALQLSGHAHAGQVRLPGIGPLILPIFGQLYPFGAYRVGNLGLYVTAGIGAAKYVLRFNCIPEIAVITLVRGTMADPDPVWRTAKYYRNRKLHQAAPAKQLLREEVMNDPILPIETRPEWSNLLPMPVSRVSKRHPMILGHRGARGLAPENTLASFQVAIDLRADGVEFDVQRTADGHLIVFHDETLDRTTGGTGPVEARTLKEIKRLDAGSMFGARFQGEHIPTLRETFDLLRQTNLLIFLELKDPWRYRGMEAETVALIREYRLEDRVQIRSFYHPALHLCYWLAPEIALSELWGDRLPSAGDVVFKTINAYYPLYTAENLAEIHARGQQATAWTVNDVDAARKLIEVGIDGLTTDYPDRLIALFEE